MKRKSQATSVGLLMLLVLLFAVLVLYLVDGYNARLNTLVFERYSIENYINQCVKKTGEDGLTLLGKQGGAIILKDYIDIQGLGISYMYRNGNKMPSIGNIQDELSFYINANLKVCFRDFEDFKRMGWGVEKGEVNANTQINQRDVTFEVDFPLKVMNKGKTIQFDRFLVNLNIRLKFIYDMVSSIVSFNEINPGIIDMTELNNYDVNVTIFPYNKSIIYAIDDSKSLIINKPYRFMFAMSFE